MKVLFALATFACLFSAQVLAAPTNGAEGVWVGDCARGSVTVPATISIDQQNARLNGEGVTSFSKNGLSLSFVLQGKFTKTFKGNWSGDTSLLTGLMTVVGMSPAQCSLTRRIASTAHVCIRNPDQTDIWWMLSPGTPAGPVILRGGSEDRGTGAAGGKLCWGTTEALARACIRSLPQNGFGC